MKRLALIALLAAVPSSAAVTLTTIAAGTTIAANVLNIRENLGKIRHAAGIAKKAARKAARRVIPAKK